MPLTKCSASGTSGYRWGTSGKCYTGPGAKKRALAQGLAENKGNEKAFRSELSKAGLLEDSDVQAFLKSVEPTGANRYLAAVAEYCEQQKAKAEEVDQAVAYVSVDTRNKMKSEDFGDPKRKRYPVPDQKHLKLAWDLSGREAPAAQKAIRSRLREIAKRKGWKVPGEDK